MRKKLIVNRQWANRHCKTCVWLIEGHLCPFQGCPKVFGWSLERKAVKRHLEGKNDDK